MVNINEIKMNYLMDQLTQNIYCEADNNCIQYICCGSANNCTQYIMTFLAINCES